MDSFRHRHRVEIRFADLDSLGHVNNAMYLTYMETARIRYFHVLKLWEERQSSRIGPIMARAELDYRLALTLDDDAALVLSRCVRLGNKSYQMEQIVTRERDGAVAAVGQIVLVAYDYQQQVSIPLPDAWRAAIRDYEPALAD